jgi:5-methylcytosine-specific restriction endonuclease McrA
MGQWGHLYGKRWRKRAHYQLQIEPLCRMCANEGRITSASVVDHVIPHRGDINSFWLGELQSLCTFHHNSTKKIIEQRGYDTAIGADGWPLDPRHPVYGRQNGTIRTRAKNPT